jgi:hypothetical protein
MAGHLPTPRAAMDFLIASPRPRDKEDTNDSFQLPLETEVLRAEDAARSRRRTRALQAGLLLLAILLLAGAISLDPETMTVRGRGAELSPQLLGRLGAAGAVLLTVALLWLLVRRMRRAGEGRTDREAQAFLVV